MIHKKLKDASEKFKHIIDNHLNGKYEHLPTWLDTVSSRFIKEINNDYPNGYYHYKRGTIIRVNFGVNMGSEFSNTHFAIVLDKKDNAKKRTLTVLHLTSKQKKGRYSLGKEVFNQTTTLLDLQTKILSEKAEESLKDEEINYQQAKQLSEEIKMLIKVAYIYSKYNKNTFVRLSDITTISKFRIQRINKFDPSGKIRLSEQQMREISNELMKLYIK